MTRHIDFRWRGLDDAIEELDDWSRVPTPRQVEALDTVLTSAFRDTQAKVHVDSGALKASGRRASDVDEDEPSWTGRISYGGTLAPHAVYEIAEQAGTEHDPFRNIAAFDDAFVHAFTLDTP